MNNSFWFGGPEAYCDSLRDLYEPLIKELKSQLQGCSNEEQRDAYEAEIAEIEAEFKAKEKEIDRLLF